MQSEVQLALPFYLVAHTATPKKNLFSRIFSSSSRSSGTVEGRDEEMELPTIETPSEIQGPGLSN